MDQDKKQRKDPGQKMRDIGHKGIGTAIRISIKNDWRLWVMIAPLLIWLAFYSFKPLGGVIIAFQNYSPFKGIEGSAFVGLENFFDYDDMVYRHDYHHVILRKQEQEPIVKWFHDIGWVAINKNRKDFKNHIFFLTKSSPYGCVSHSHGDQNSFVLFAYEEPLIIRSGYYIGFNTSMHRDWRKQTRSHNNLLINGQGQYAQMDKALQLRAAGAIEAVEERKDCIYIRENATSAYLEHVPDLTQYTREIYFVDETYFILVDSVFTESPSWLDWRLHSLTKFEIHDEKFGIQCEKAILDGRFVYCSSGIGEISQTDQFTGVDQAELTGLDNQWHLNMKTKKAKNHIVVTLLVPSKKQEKNIVTSIKDDQGHDVYYYFSHDGNTFSLRLDGNKRY